MKRIAFVFLAALIGVGALSAQESSEPSEESVLEKAREKYGTSTTTTTTTTTTTVSPGQPAQTLPAPSASPAPTVTAPTQPPAPAGGQVIIIINPDGPQAAQAPEDEDNEPEQKSRYRYTPYVLSFVPGLSIPMGIYDTSIAAGAIGSMAGNVYGAQGAGVFSIALGKVGGVQGSGVFNIANSVFGFQAAGVFNITGPIMGGQGAGVFNIADTVQGAQGAGIFNIADEVSLGQAAGVFNIADRVKGFQLAGVANISDSTNGVMAASVINVTGKSSGAMIGLVNIADELDGVAIGLVNIIGNGVHDISADYQFDSQTAYLTYRSGTPMLYGSVYAGQPANQVFRSLDNVTMGVGVGHRFKFLFLTTDLEYCYEMPMDPVALNRAFGNGINVHAMPWGFGFQSLRASFGFGDRKGFGAYLGIKTDIGIAGVSNVPARLQTAFGSAAPYTFDAFGTPVQLWPKVFLGLRF